MINTFNAWKKTAAAGRIFVVREDGIIEVQATGLVWRSQVCQQVFEEAAVDCSRALAAFSDSGNGKRAGKRVGFPRFKRKNRSIPSFRIRSKHTKAGWTAIRIGDDQIARSVTLPGIGVVRVREDTRRLRRLLAKERAKILYATVTYRARRWWVSLTLEAADLHSAHRRGHRTVDKQPRGWPSTTVESPIFAVTSPIRSRTGWSRPTTGL
ncbi:hypothetical protein [Nocardia fluminea]|uniref:hypothetical protein n=1 Tax=Nocardia fluminea TaxID=134984 RepID=UPI003D10B276